MVPLRLTVLNNWLLTRSYVVGYTPSQADVATFKALSSAPDATKYPNAARWYKHIASFEDEFATLSGDATKPYTAYGPEVSEVTLNPAKAPAAEAEDDEDVDLFGSDDDEEEDAEAARIREERLAEYRKKKEGKTKPAAKSIVTMDVKPWGKLKLPPSCLGGYLGLCPFHGSRATNMLDYYSFPPEHIANCAPQTTRLT
jgi:elongation factor 1-beta